MEAISQLQNNDIEKIIFPTISAFIPLLQKNVATITQVQRKAFKYGATDRHQLDVYYPTTGNGTSKAPLLFFVYGGGFTSGERSYPAPFDLGYRNLGSYFAQRGFITIIPDYRLVPHVSYPGPAEDVRDAINWAVHNPEHLSIPDSPQPNVDSIFVMGHSVGATQIFTMLLSPDILASTELRSKIIGVVLNGGIYHFDNFTPENPFSDVLTQYYGSLEETKTRHPLALLNRASSDIIKSLPKILMAEAEADLDYVIASGKVFHQTLETRTQTHIQKIIASGHNHVSPDWALGSGEGEEWAEKSTEWMRSVQKA